MPTKPRLFFSHSTQTGSVERKILTDLAGSLKGKYAILLDRETLVPGEVWRSALNVWIGTCDAAVILVTPASIASEFCQYEWSLLSYREKAQPGFKIVPIYYETNPQAIKDKPHQISEILGFSQYSSPQQLSEEVAAWLAEVSVQLRPAELQAVFIAKLLEDYVGKLEVIDRVAARIQIEFGTWDPHVDKWRDFAIKIMGVGLERARPALRDLKQWFGNKNVEQFKDLVTLIGCSWVDIASAQRIGALKRHITKRGPFGLNAENPETAKFYVLSGSDRAPSNNWPVGTTHGVFKSYSDLHGQIQAALLEVLAPDADATQLKEELELLQRDEEPVFVVLRAEGLSAAWLEDLCADDLFTWVTFFILTGEAGDSRGLLPDDAVLTPILSKGFEQRVWKSYEDTKKTLRLT